MTATFYVGDAIEVMNSLPENSVDLVLSSPPFLNLRSYLPSDHPDKDLEGGSQSTPGEFVDWLLDVVEACDRVLAPHGSLVFELGDTFSGSGGAGGDYAEDGWRNGQPRFGGSASRARESRWSFADAKWLAGVFDTEGSIHVHKNKRAPNPSFVIWLRVTMMDREVCDRIHALTGVGNITQDKRKAYTWSCASQQARYVLLHIWPHLLIKQRQAKACIELARHMEEEERRGRYAPLNHEQVAYRQMIKDHVTGWNYRGLERGTFPTTWEPPTPPHVRSPMMAGLDWPLAKSLSLIPESFRWAMVYGRNPFTGRECGTWRLRNVIRWVRPNPPVGALGDKFRPATSELMVFCKAKDRFFDLDATREPYLHPNHPQVGKDATGKKAEGRGNWATFPTCAENPAGAPPLDWWNIPPGGYPGSHYAVWPPELLIKPIKAMCPESVCRICGTPSRRIVESDRNAQWEWSNCGCSNGHCSNEYACPDHWRNGLVLDPFGGSGTTALVATGHGRDCILIDLDERNYGLALDRVGPLILERGIQQLEDVK